MGRKANTVERLHERYVSINTDGCWVWSGKISNCGYAEAKLNERTVLAHRAFYEHYVGPIPPGLQIDHLCRNRPCVNPSHLEPVTARENSRRSDSVSGLNARKTHCILGHPLSGENLRHDTRGARVCIICVRNRQRRANAAYRERGKMSCR